METPLELRLRQLVHCVDELHINLQRVSCKTLSNSRTTSLEDRLQLLEQGPSLEVEPTISTQIFDDLTMQMSISEKRMESLEKRMEQYHKEFYEFQDFWFDEDKHNTVVINSEMMQTIKLQSDRQAAKLKLIVDTRILWLRTNCGHLSRLPTAHGKFTQIFLSGNLGVLQQLHPSEEELQLKKIPVVYIKVGLQIKRPLVCCRYSIVSEGTAKKKREMLINAYNHSFHGWG